MFCFSVLVDEVVRNHYDRFILILSDLFDRKVGEKSLFCKYLNRLWRKKTNEKAKGEAENIGRSMLVFFKKYKYCD